MILRQFVKEHNCPMAILNLNGLENDCFILEKDYPLPQELENRIVMDFYYEEDNMLEVWIYD